LLRKLRAFGGKKGADKKGWGNSLVLGKKKEGGKLPQKKKGTFSQKRNNSQETNGIPLRVRRKNAERKTAPKKNESGPFRISATTRQGAAINQGKNIGTKTRKINFPNPRKNRRTTSSTVERPNFTSWFWGVGGSLFWVFFGAWVTLVSNGTIETGGVHQELWKNLKVPADLEPSKEKKLKAPSNKS